MGKSRIKLRIASKKKRSRTVSCSCSTARDRTSLRWSLRTAGPDLNTTPTPSVRSGLGTLPLSRHWMFSKSRQHSHHEFFPDNIGEAAFDPPLARWAIVVYFYGPVAGLLVTNCVFFALTARSLSKHRQETAILQIFSPNSARRWGGAQNKQVGGRRGNSRCSARGGERYMGT